MKEFKMNHKQLSVVPVAVTVQISCPNPECDRKDPIPAFDGSLVWDARGKLPHHVTCPTCQQWVKIYKKVSLS